MGLSDARASNNLLVGLGIGIITAVTGLSAAGTFTAINAMNRQSEEAIAEAQRHQSALLAAQQSGQGSDPTQGGTVTVPEDPDEEPSVRPSDPVTVPPADEAWTSPQIKWMQENHITYDEYGFPRDEDGNLMNDPTTDIYDPSRVIYFFEADGTLKAPFVDSLPQQTDEDIAASAQRPVYAPDVDVPREDDESSDDGMGPIRNPTVDLPSNDDSGEGDGNPTVKPVNPGVETPGQDGDGDDGDDGDGEDEDMHGGTSVTNPDVDVPEQRPVNPDGWWFDENGELLPGLTLDENGKPYYVVKRGDSLGGIGAKYGFPYMELAEASGISNPGLLYTGDIVRFPDHDPTGTGTAATEPVVAPPTLVGSGSGGHGTGNG